MLGIVTDTFLYIYGFAFALYIGVNVIAKIVMKFLGKYEITPLSVQREELVTIPFLSISLLGIYGYLESVSILSQLFWQIYTVLLFSMTVTAFWLPKLKWLRSEVSFRAYAIMSIVGLTINFPMYCILLVYAFVAYPGVVHT